MQFLETRSEVKFKVTVTKLWYVTHHPKLHPHTKFEIPTSNNMRYAPDRIILKTRSEVKIKVTVIRKWYATLHHPKMHQDASTHQIWNSYLKEDSDPKMVCNTPPSQDASTHHIWNSYLKEGKR